MSSDLLPPVSLSSLLEEEGGGTLTAPSGDELVCGQQPDFDPEYDEIDCTGSSLSRDIEFDLLRSNGEVTQNVVALRISLDGPANVRAEVVHDQTEGRAQNLFDRHVTNDLAVEGTGVVTQPNRACIIPIEYVDYRDLQECTHETEQPLSPPPLGV